MIVDERRARPRDRLRRLHRHAHGARAARRGRARDRRRQLRSLLRRRAEGGAARDARRHAGLRVRAHRPRRADADGAACSRDGAFAQVVHLAAQPGVRYSLVNPGRVLRATTSTAFGHVARRLPPREASRISSTRRARQRVRREPRAAVLRGPARRPSGEPLRRDEEGQRADGAQLQPSVPAADDGAALLHRLRAVGPARHGADAVHQGDPRGRADPACSTTGRCGATSPTSTTSSKASCACSSGRPRPTATRAPYAIYNIGNHEAVDARRRSSRRSSGCSAATAIRDYAPMQPGDVPATYASIDRLRAATGFAPRTPLADGLARFVAWYREYYGARTGVAHGRIALAPVDAPARLPMILVTGGAGFIGANFVLDWLAATGEPVVNLDKLTYAGNLGNLASLARRCAARLRARRHRRPRAGRRAAGASIGRARSSISPPRRHVDRSIHGPAAFIETNVVGTFKLLEAARAFWSALPARRARRVPLPARLDRRGVRLARRRTIRRSPRRRRTRRTARTRRRRRRPTIWCAPITTPTACRR